MSRGLVFLGMLWKIRPSSNPRVLGNRDATKKEPKDQAGQTDPADAPGGA